MIRNNRIKGGILTILMALSTIGLFAQNSNSKINNGYNTNDVPTVQQTAAKVAGFISAGWKIISEVKGDLNGDLLEDKAIVLQNTNPANFLKNEGMGGNTLNVNPRMLLVLFQKSDHTYQLAARSNGLVPPANDESDPCLTDPFAEEGNLSIDKGLLKINLQYFYSCADWEVNNNHYIFRFQNQKFELIGYEHHIFDRASGSQTSKSVNFSTAKMSETTGKNAFANKGLNPKTIWKTIKKNALLNLESIKQDDLDHLSAL